MNQQKVPQALVSTGASYWGLQYKEFPYTSGWQPDYIAEGRLYGLHIKANYRGKKIAIVYQNDDYGKDYLYGFLAALGKQYADANVVAREAVETTATSVAANMVRVRASGATILAVFQLPTPTTRTIGTAKALGINPEQIYMNSVANVKPAMDGMVAGSGGAVHERHHHDHVRARIRRIRSGTTTPAMKQYRSIIAKYGGGANANDPQVAYGVAKAMTFVQLLYTAGRNLTRASLHERAPEHELREQVPASWDRPEDVQDGPLHRQPDAAPAVQREHPPVGALREARSRVARARAASFPYVE